MKIAKKLIVILLLVSICASMLPLTASANRTIAWGAANAVGHGVRIRSGPGLDHSVLTSVNRGEVIVILERTSSEWNRVSFHGTVGFVSAPLLDNPRKIVNFTGMGSITGGNVNMRARPDTSSNILGTYRQDTVMSILGINEGWYKVQHGGHTGYIRSDFMNIVSRSATATSAGSNAQGSISGSNVNMRSEPNVSSNILSTHRLGTIMNIVGESNGWYRVQHNGNTGYVRADLMQVPPAPPSTHTAAPAHNPLGQQIADYARSYTGHRYVWGGTAPGGFDCSGLVTYVLRNFGIRVTRTASGQFRDNGVHINKSDLQPGDLVFFSSNGGRSVTHVGIYIGNNQFVHASNSRVGVVVSSLGSSYYTRVWHGAKRVI